jgi:hypothetical protein
MLVTLCALLALQTPEGRGRAAAVPAGSTSAAALASAVRAVRSPVIDGRDDDEVWQTASPITEFLEFEPVEGKEARFRTEARVAYDQHNFYVFIRMHDPEPERILKLLARRDVRTPSDQVKIMIDSYHDRRSGYSFAVNPGGVLRDYAMSNDGNEDEAWDGVWEAKTTVDSLGWTAEFRIPLSQLRYANAEQHTFGFGIWRDIDRYKERVSWPLYRRQQAGLVSQLGQLNGISGLSSPRRLEARPYAVTKNITLPEGDRFSHPQRFDAGLDFKYGVSSNLTVDGTINPDFGQVEADPAVLNLSAFETFFQERRPFFMEGAGLLSFPVNCFAVRDCGVENLFYSRRIGRSPQLAGQYGDARSATGTTILGAAKLTGRLPGGLSLGVLNAVTGREEGTQERTIEPLTNYALVRANQDLRRGETSIGMIATLVNRSSDEWTSGQLRSSALVSGADFRHRFSQGRFQLSGSLVASRVAGSEEAIALTQRNSVHFYQRPDADLGYDPTRSSLTGSALQLRFAKFGGGMLRFETSFQRVSPGFESNDMGFLRRADWQSFATWAQLAFNRPTSFYRRAFWNVNLWGDWTSDGLPLERAFNTNVHAELPNSWWIHAGGTAGGLGTLYCDRCARGGPALRTDDYLAPWGGIEGDSRWVVVPGIWLNGYRSDGGRSRSFTISPSLSFRVSSQLTSSLGLNLGRNVDDRQWLANVTDDAGATHYTFAHLVQHTRSLRARVNYTVSPTLTIQAYAEPFMSRGRYSDVRELADPRAADYDDRFQSWAGGDPAGFNFKQFRSNLVLRWEYRPGSALYVVWQQGRTDPEQQYSDRPWRDELSRLFRSPADNTFLIKLSYWLDR